MGRRLANLFWRLAKKFGFIWGNAHPLIEVGKHRPKITFVEPAMVQDEYVWDDTYYYGLIVPEGCANPVTLDWEEIEKDEFDGDAEFVSRTRYEQRMKKNFWNDAMQTFGELAGMDTKLLVLLAFNMILTLGVLAVVVKYLVVP